MTFNAHHQLVTNHLLTINRLAWPAKHLQSMDWYEDASWCQLGHSSACICPEFQHDAKHPDCRFLVWCMWINPNKVFQNWDIYKSYFQKRKKLRETWQYLHALRDSADSLDILSVDDVDEAVIILFYWSLGALLLLIAKIESCQLYWCTWCVSIMWCVTSIGNGSCQWVMGAHLIIWGYS